jgi:hypothetical protein
MPKFKVTYWQHAKFQITIEAEDVEHAIELCMYGDTEEEAEMIGGMDECDDFEAEEIKE